MKEAKVATQKNTWKIDKLRSNANHITVNGYDRLGLNCSIATVWRVTPEEMQANAKLICAAPEMYQTLKAVKEALENLDGTEYGFPGIDKLLGECSCVIDKVQSK